MVVSQRYAQVSDDDDDDLPLSVIRSNVRNPINKHKKRDKEKLCEDVEIERKRKRMEDKEDEEKEKENPDKAKPIGEPVKFTGKGKLRKAHFQQFEYDGNTYGLEEPVILAPEDIDQKPYVAMIKDITLTDDGGIMIMGQWFYRPEEAEKKNGGNWQSLDTRELFYSFHYDEVPAESVMHRCLVYFVPAHKQLPKRQTHPGFIVQKVYDTVEKKLWKLTDKDYEDDRQGEIDVLVEKTMSRLGHLPDLDDDPQKPVETTKRCFKEPNVTPVDVRKQEYTSLVGEYRSILEKYDSLTGDTHRDKWLGKLLEAVENICYKTDIKEGGDDEVVTCFLWPDAAIPPVCALEKATYGSLSSDSVKYNQKMRTLVYNLKKTGLLARRLLNGELEAVEILNMSFTELKEGLTAKETNKETDNVEKIQMTDARCSRCSKVKVGLRDIIRAGHGDRYKLECIACGHSWYASRDEVSTLTIAADKTAKGSATENGKKKVKTNVDKQS